MESSLCVVILSDSVCVPQSVCFLSLLIKNTQLNKHCTQASSAALHTISRIMCTAVKYLYKIFKGGNKINGILNLTE